MFVCHVCGNTTARHELTSETFVIDEKRALVEQIPAEVCERCGEATFPAQTAERIRRMIHSGARPVKTVPLDVFALT